MALTESGRTKWLAVADFPAEENEVVDLGLDPFGLQDQFMRWALQSKVKSSAFCCPFLVKLCGVGRVPTTFNPIMLLSTVGVGSPIDITNTQLSWLMRTPLFLLVVATTALSFLLRIPTICLHPLATFFSNPLFISRLGELIKGMVRLAAIPT
jgi:hypothetical protein